MGFEGTPGEFTRIEAGVCARDTEHGRAPEVPAVRGGLEELRVSFEGTQVEFEGTQGELQGSDRG